MSNINENEIVAKMKVDASNYHKSGYNCAECLLRSFLDNYDIDLPDEIMGMATGFGGGIGRNRHICGAVTGAVLALGTIKGRPDPGSKDAMPVATAYKPFKSMFAEMEEHFGTVICKDMLAVRTDENGNEIRRNCTDTVAYCAGKLAEYANKGE